MIEQFRGTKRLTDDVNRQEAAAGRAFVCRIIQPRVPAAVFREPAAPLPPRCRSFQSQSRSDVWPREAWEEKRKGKDDRRARGQR